MKPKGRVDVGDMAPDFVLPDQSGQPVRLRDLIGEQALVLYFYPKDGTPGCTLEARAFQRSHDRFTEAGARVVGISADSVASHRRFAARQGLSFPLLSDRGNAVRELYGVEKTLGLLPGRATYVIDAKGVVRNIFSSQVLVTRHSRNALGTLEKLRDTP